MTTIIWNYVGLILGIASIVATAYFAIKYSERKDPRLHYLSFPNIAKSRDVPETIEIFYLGNKVPRVSSTIVRFWNAGKRPIRKDDIPTTQPVTLHISDISSDVQILDVSVSKKSREAISFKATKSDAAIVKLEFDFLDQNDGAAIEIQHTGTWRATVKAEGVILGASAGIKVVPSRFSGLFTGFDRIVMYPPSLIRRGNRPRALVSVAMSIAIVGLFGGMIWFCISSSGDITTNSTLLKKVLTAYILDDRLPNAVDQICATSKFQTLNKIGPYGMSLLFAVNAAYGLAAVWKNRSPFPSSLLIQRSAENSRKSSTSKVDSDENAEFA